MAVEATSSRAMDSSTVSNRAMDNNLMGTRRNQDMVSRRDHTNSQHTSNRVLRVDNRRAIRCNNNNHSRDMDSSNNNQLSLAVEAIRKLRLPNGRRRPLQMVRSTTTTNARVSRSGTNLQGCRKELCFERAFCLFLVSSCAHLVLREICCEFPCL